MITPVSGSPDDGVDVEDQLCAGFAYRGIRNNRQRLDANRPFSAYNVPVSLKDPGPDGVVGTTDDGAIIQGYNLDPALAGLKPDNVTTMVPDRYGYYNLLNANPLEAMNWSSGSSFMRPTTIPGPRIVRLGCKFDW